MLKLYVCDEKNGDGRWLSRQFREFVAECREASSEDIIKYWQPGNSNFEGQVLNLSDGDFTAEVYTVPMTRGGKELPYRTVAKVRLHPVDL